MILIADDFGLGRGHDEVILDLLEKGQLTGTSVMVNNAIAAKDITTLISLRKKHSIQIGLHLNLTQDLAEIKAVAPISKLLRDSILGRLSKDLLRKKIKAQISQFKRIFNIEPDFIDGHQHCHILPGVTSVLARTSHQSKTWVRIPAPKTIKGFWLNLNSGGIKTLLIVMLAWLAKSKFKQNSWAISKDFSGFLTLDSSDKAISYLPKILSQASENCVVMVHPGDQNDPIQCIGHIPEIRTAEAKILHES